MTISGLYRYGWLPEYLLEKYPQTNFSIIREEATGDFIIKSPYGERRLSVPVELNEIERLKALLEIKRQIDEIATSPYDFKTGATNARREPKTRTNIGPRKNELFS